MVSARTEQLHAHSMLDRMPSQAEQFSKAASSMVLPLPLLSLCIAAVASHACLSRVHINPACVESLADTTKWPRPGRNKDTPISPRAKRRRRGKGSGTTPMKQESMLSKEGVANLPLLLMQSGCHVSENRRNVSWNHGGLGQGGVLHQFSKFAGEN